MRNRIRQHMEPEPAARPEPVTLESDRPCYECATGILAGRVSLLQTILGTLVRLSEGPDTPEVAALRAQVAENGRDVLEDPSWWERIYHGPSERRN